MRPRISPYGSTRSRRRSRGHRPMATINVTPFVDVTLVLLIVFMVTAPLLSVGVPVDLPETDAARPLTEQNSEQELVISIDGDGLIYISETVVERSALINALNHLSQQDFDRRVYIRGDKALSYGDVLALMGMVSAAGYNHVTLVGEYGE